MDIKGCPREQMMVRLPAGLKEELRREAGGMGITLNALVLQILWDWAKQNDAVKLRKQERGE